MKIYDYRINQATMNELAECIDNLFYSPYVLRGGNAIKIMEAVVRN